MPYSKKGFACHAVVQPTDRAHLSHSHRHLHCRCNGACGCAHLARASSADRQVRASRRYHPCRRPIILNPIAQILRGNFSVDLLALLSITTSIILGQYWVAGIVILMLSGGEALEEHATRRASSVLAALAKRMPQIAHRIQPDGSLADIAIDRIAVGNHLRLFPHEICPVAGVVVSGDGSMDES
jgi:cation transport ATPase